MIPKELVEQWLQESGNYDVAVAQVEYIAQRAAAHGAAQRDAELMGVGMEPEIMTHLGTLCYTATQLAAALLQGAEDERKRKTCPTCEALARTVMMDQTGKA